jgi:toxin secretion/phage lysis holin
MKMNFLQTIFAAVSAAIAAYLNILLVPLIVLIVVMIIDYLSGMAQAYVSHTLNSRIGVIGILKKVGYLATVAVAVIADYIISEALMLLGTDIKLSYYIGLVVTIWFIINELISILENLAEIGTPIPKFLTKIIKRLKVTVEKKTDTEESEDNNNE